MKTVLITGASSGIGKELARLYAIKGYNEVLVARREELLKNLQEELTKSFNVDVKYFVCDLAKNPKDVYDYCVNNSINIDILVNNAGYGDYGRFIDADLDKTLGMIELNNKALVALTYYFIKDMKNSGGGHILNVASVASFMPGPFMAVYYATKAFVMSFSAAIREELKRDHIKVSVLCPAPTKSPFWDVAGSTTTAVYDNTFARTSIQAAQTGIDVVNKNKLYSVDGLVYKLLIGFVRHMPIALSAKVVGFIQSKTKEKN